MKKLFSSICLAVVLVLTACTRHQPEQSRFDQQMVRETIGVILVTWLRSFGMWQERIDNLSEKLIFCLKKLIFCLNYCIYHFFFVSLRVFLKTRKGNNQINQYLLT